MPVPVLPSEPMFIKEALEKLICPIHNKHLKVEISGDEILYLPCCDEFLSQIKDEMDNIRSDAFSKAVHYTIKLGCLQGENNKM